MSYNLSELQDFYKKGRLCLFVGAGASESCGLSGWQSLSNSIVAKAIPDKLSRGDVGAGLARHILTAKAPLDAMRHIRMTRNNVEFNKLVVDCLYQNSVKLSPLINAIASMANIGRICCFNYDDVLEEGFTAQGHKFRVLTEGDEIPFQAPPTLIFHPHGFLPRTSAGNAYLDKGIVLSEDDYFSLYATPYSWANLLQLNLLMNYCVLFIGMSLTDPSIRRLLDICKQMKIEQMHYALLKDPTYQPTLKGWDLFPFPTMKGMEEDALAYRGIAPIWYEKHADIPAILAEIAS